LVRDDPGEPFKPEAGQARQQPALAGNGVGQDDIEGRNTIAGDDQQLVGVNRVDVPHLAAAEQRQAGDRRFKKGFGHVVDPQGE
jgi:hypothetical protein